MVKKYGIEIKKSAVKSITSLPSSIKKRLWEAIEELAENPRPDRCRKISGLETNRYRIRVGDYRVIYRIYDDILLILIVRVGHRREIYRGI